MEEGGATYLQKVVFYGHTFQKAVKTPGPPDFQFLKKITYCLLRLQHHVGCHRANKTEFWSYPLNEQKIQTRGQGSTGIVVYSLNERVSPGPGSRHRGRASRLEDGFSPVTRDSPRRVSAARPGAACPPNQPVSALPGKTDHRLLPDGGKLPQTPRAATDSPRGAARPARPRCPRFPPRPPRLPANARDHGSATVFTLFRERTNTLEGTASPPRQRGALLRTRTGSAPPPGSWGAPLGTPGRRVFCWPELGPASRGR